MRHIESPPARAPRPRAPRPRAPRPRALPHAVAAVALTAVGIGLAACSQDWPVTPASTPPAAVATLGTNGAGPAIPGGAFASFDAGACAVSLLPPGISADVPFPGFGGLSLSTTGFPLYDIGPLPGGQPSFAYDVNDNGQVVGGSLQPEGWRAFAWTQGGGFTNLGTLPGGNVSFAQGNNNLNQVVGYSTSSAGHSGFKWTSGGGMVALASLPGGSYSDAWEINDAGQIAGWSRINADDDHATLWSAAGVPQDLGVLPGGRKSYAYDVSNAGHVVGFSFSSLGQRAFLWTAGGGMQDLGLLPGAIWTRAMGVNDLGQVVGYALMPTGHYRAWYWSPSTGMIDIGSLGGVSTQDAVAWDINNAGQVAGYSRTSTTGSGGEVLAFVWTYGGGMVSLGKHPSACSSYGYGISNTGYVAGSDEFSGLGLGNRSALWTIATPGSGQGCTPGYWKQDQHFDSWKWFTPANMVNDVFGVTYASTQNNNPTGPLTLLQALQLNGNDGSEALFRQGVAALLNSAYQSGVSYPYTTFQVISMVRNAWLSNDKAQWNLTKNAFETANGAVCPLN